MFQIANPTVLERPGALMLYPIYQLLFGEHGKTILDDPSLELTEDQIVINYTTYKTTAEDDMQAIFDDKLTPG